MDVFTKLVKISDVVLDNSSPGVMGRLGLAQADLEKIKKDHYLGIFFPAAVKSGRSRILWFTLR